MRKFKLFITVFLLMTMLTGTSLTISAHSNITYDCGEHVFIIDPGTDKAPLDLFPNFKNVIPGQSLTQEIWVGNDENSSMVTMLYLRSLGAKEGSEEFLSQLKLTVSDTEGRELFNGKASETAQLTDWVQLTWLNPGDHLNLFLTLEVPVTLDNTFQDAVGTLQWEFRAEEHPIPDETEEALPEPAKPGVTTPHTGDQMEPGWYMGLVFASAALLIFWVRMGIKEGASKHGKR